MPENASVQKTPPLFPEEFRGSKKRRSKSKAFRDAPYWDNLATKYLSGYKLPNWGVQTDSDAILVWMGRINVSMGRFKDTLGTSPEDFVKLNKKWPMRAVIGLLLEVRDERDKPQVG